MNKDQGGGIAERLVYGVVMWIAMKFVAKGYIDADMAAYLAAGAVTLFGGAYAWWHNRPVSVLNRAGDAVPKNTKIVITPNAAASSTEKAEAQALASAASDKVVADVRR